MERTRCRIGGRSFLPAEKIHLGLDLQGGTILVLEVKVDKAVENQRRAGQRATWPTLLRRTGVSDVSVERVEGTQMQVKAPAANAERVRGILKGDFGNLRGSEDAANLRGRHTNSF